jgi:cbb3-type cytochrome oxidase subunit 3
MDIHDLRGVMSALILMVFIGLFVWVSLGGRERFREAAALPFADEERDPEAKGKAQEPQP